MLGLYQAHVPEWTRARGTGLIERSWLDAFLAALPEDDRPVLDLGCGTGTPIAGYLIANGCRVTGIDGAPGMIEQARAGFPDHDWRVGDIRDLPVMQPFGGLIAWHSLFHLTPEAQRALFSAFARLARPGAALMFTSGTTHGETIGQFEGRPLYHASLDTDDYRSLLARNGFTLLRHVQNDRTCGDATVWLARRTGRSAQPVR